jgi:hypothetical protein
VVVQFEMRLVSGHGFSRAETESIGTGFKPLRERRIKNLRYERDRISEFTGTPEGDALTRIFFKLHHVQKA